MSKLALGTVQFGQKYGINNVNGEIPYTEICDILDFAAEHKIDMLDTAYNYGSSEEKIGAYISKSSNRFNIISKLPAHGVRDPNYFFHQSMQKLNVDTLYGYLSHDFITYINNTKLADFFKSLKENNKVCKIGVSVYYPYEVEELFNKNIDFDLVQLPYNIFDQRFEDIMRTLKKERKEIHVRSVFLQGLVFKNPNNLDAQFNKIKNKLIKLKNCADQFASSIQEVRLNFVLSNKNIDRLIVGVDTTDNLKDIVSIVEKENQFNKIEIDKDYFRIKDENILLPFNWKL